MAADWLLCWDRYSGEVEPAHLEAIAAGLTAMGWSGGGGGGGVQLTEDPANPGLYLLGAGGGSMLTPDPANPGLYLLGGSA